MTSINIKRKRKICFNDPDCVKVGCRFRHPLRHKLMLEQHMKKKKILLVFDLNGTLTSLTKVRYKQGACVRPGIQNLSKLFSSDLFHLAIWSSAMEHNVVKMKNMLEEELGQQFDMVLTRKHTIPSPIPEKKWETKKPLEKNFGKDYGIKRVLLIDDNTNKILQSEVTNLLQVPWWDEDIPDNGVLDVLVELLLELKNLKDVRNYTKQLQEKLWALTRN